MLAYGCGGRAAAAGQFGVTDAAKAFSNRSLHAARHCIKLRSLTESDRILQVALIAGTESVLGARATGVPRGSATMVA